MAIEDDITTFRTAAASTVTLDRFFPPNWSNLNWTRLFARATSTHFVSGTPILRRGAFDRDVFFLVRGRAEVFASDAENMNVAGVSLVLPGSVIGEASFFDGSPRSASVWAIENCDLMLLTREAFDRFASEHPHLAGEVIYALGTVLASRLRHTTDRVSN
jgi:CRP/FNR family transcriptional regulator, cyclic AMP receptor protein